MSFDHAKITVLNGDGSGFAKEITVPVGTTLEKVIADNNFDSAKNVIKVGNLPRTSDYVMQDGDVLTVNPIAKKLASGK